MQSALHGAAADTQKSPRLVRLANAMARLLFLWEVAVASWRAASILAGVVLDIRGLQDVHVRPQDRMAEAGAASYQHPEPGGCSPMILCVPTIPGQVAVATVVVIF